MTTITTYDEFASAYPPDAKGVHHVLSGDMSTLSEIELPPGHTLDVLASPEAGCISGGFTQGTARTMSARGRGRW